MNDGVRGAMVNIVGNGHDDRNLNSGQHSLHFT